MSRPAAQALLCKYFGLKLPYFNMGKVDTLDLFGQNELILFAFYESRRDRYARALDIGANVGLHAMLMLRLGWEVRSFEPDPEVFARMANNVQANDESHLWTPCKAAVSDRDGTAPFVRVLNNLTGSHLAGYKESYGPTETVQVATVAAEALFDWVGEGVAGFVKIDAEGHEAVILAQATTGHMQNMDVMTEVRGDREGAKIMRHFGSLGIPMYSQKIGWKRVECMSDMPRHHSEGSLFISTRGAPFDGEYT